MNSLEKSSLIEETNIVDGPYIGGNYWENYTGFDTNHDGIGDTSIYNDSGSISNGWDLFPLVISPLNLSIL